MLNKQTQIWVVEIGNNEMTLCIPGRNNLLEIKYPDGVIADMEIADPSRMLEIVNESLKEIKIDKTEVIVIFNDSLCFEMDLSSLPSSEQDVRFASFLETVPFESVLARKFRIDEKKVFAAAVNRAVYDFFRGMLYARGLEIVAAVPAIVARSMGYEGQLNSKICNLLYKKAPLLKAVSFISETYDQTHFGHEQRHFINKHQGLFAALSVVFIVLCGFTAYYTLQTPKPVNSNTAVIRPKPTPTPTAEPTPTVIPVNINELRVTVIRPRTNTNISTIQEQMLKDGFTNLAVQTATVSATETSIEFSKRTPPDARKLVEDMMRVSFPSAKSSEVSQSEFDISIVIGTN